MNGTLLVASLVLSSMRLDRQRLPQLNEQNPIGSSVWVSNQATYLPATRWWGVV